MSPLVAPRAETIAQFRGVLSQPEAFLVGAAVGAGITARAAERGGADLLLALNAGRFRMMGASSIAAMLPLRNSNEFVAEFALNEILNHAKLPVFFGAANYRSNDYSIVLSRRIRDQGFSGISNFPTCIHYGEEFQHLLERNGMGFDRELKLVIAGQNEGLCGVVYVGSVQQARLAAQAGADVVCMNFGWNTGSLTGVVTSMSLSDVASRSREFVKTVRSWSPASLCLLEGGPIEKAEDLFEICRQAKVDGYIGGSTIDLMPLDISVAEATAEFKMTRVLQGRIKKLEKRLAKYQIQHDLIGNSEQVTGIIKRVSAFSQDHRAAMVSGESGTGKTVVAESLARHYLPNGVIARFSFDESTLEQRAVAELFGVASNRQSSRKNHSGLLEANGAGVVIIENIELAPKSIQTRIVQFLEAGCYKRVYGRKLQQSKVKLIMTAAQSFLWAPAKGRVLPELVTEMRRRRIDLPPLRERIGDIPGLVRHFSDLNANQLGFAQLELTPAALRELMNYDWPENVAELASMIKTLQAAQVFGKVSADAVLRVLDKGWVDDGNRPAENSEKIWILQALRRNGFRRAKAASELGMSRKTLYNKIKRFKIMG